MIYVLAAGGVALAGLVLYLTLRGPKYVSPAQATSYSLAKSRAASRPIGSGSTSSSAIARSTHDDMMLNIVTTAVVLDAVTDSDTTSSTDTSYDSGSSSCDSSSYDSGSSSSSYDSGYSSSSYDSGSSYSSSSYDSGSSYSSSSDCGSSGW